MRVDYKDNWCQMLKSYSQKFQHFIQLYDKKIESNCSRIFNWRSSNNFTYLKKYDILLPKKL